VLLVEQALLQEGERQRVMGRCAEVVAAGAVPLLVQLCGGPDGPLPVFQAPSVAEGLAADLQAHDEMGKSGSKKKKKGSKKKKKAKLEPGVFDPL
jgi:hypothetical protein